MNEDTNQMTRRKPLWSAADDLEKPYKRNIPR